ncbi:conserved hypothetical protein [Thermotomaculum hydrothermale]|uniref:AAA ATPase n=1 Tax=Thermotomaculum hydrothermale TaxID=981385 RepID=A0A7R6Q0G1_9BACT|nr:ATP-binding protein [Thermotomaculum hydrothermale]BBB33253.1 conserved hypothetical protein [Thermotomaculum hydrothermale]
MYERLLQRVIQEKIDSGKAIIVLGARQVGKTTLINTLLKDKDFLFIDGDDPKVRAIFSEPNTEEIRSIIGNHKFVFIDEAQRIKGIGITIKIIVDKFKKVQLFVTGSSSFELSGQINEFLTGRKWEYRLFPISWEEFKNHHGYLYSEQQLENRLIYGFYPEVLNNPGNEKEVLKELVSSYLYKDVLSFGGIKKPDILDRLLQFLALQLGSEISYSEIAQTVGVDKNTVSRYIDILEKAFVVFKLNAFSRNMRNEIRKNKKIYFYDTGIRNALIGDFRPLSLRQDKGGLWENFLIAERIKQLEYKRRFARIYFWRTKQQQEVDFIEDIDGKIFGYEFKWEKKRGKGLPKTFVKNYKAETKVIDRKNFRDFVIIKE